MAAHNGFHQSIDIGRFRPCALSFEHDRLTGPQASWCELMALMAVRAPTVNRDLAGAARRRAKNGHSPTI